MLAARPMSPFAFSLPLMNMITGLALPETTLTKSTGATVIASCGWSVVGSVGGLAPAVGDAHLVRVATRSARR